MRDVPFTCIQFSLYEYFKSKLAIHQNVSQIDPIYAAVCGSGAGAIAAAVTTPLDVIKTRVMLSELSASRALKQVTREGYLSFFKGIVPRVAWISLGGFIFLGTYEKSLEFF